MRVYRVAHTSSTSRVAGQPFPSGPYAADDDEITEALYSALAHTQWDKNHPAPHEDRALGTIYHSEVCGVSSMDALLDWFAGALARLDEVGFVVWTYDVPDRAVRVGSRAGQVLFVASAAVPVSKERIPLEDQQLALFETGDVLPGPVVRDNETPGQPRDTDSRVSLGTSSPDQ